MRVKCRLDPTKERTNDLKERLKENYQNLHGGKKR